VAFLVHAGLDWDWEVPAVTLTGVFCAGALVVEGRPEGTRTISMAVRRGLFGFLILLLAAVAIRRRPAAGLLCDP